jgi:hypothetical protein
MYPQLHGEYHLLGFNWHTNRKRFAIPDLGYVVKDNIYHSVAECGTKLNTLLHINLMLVLLVLKNEV